MAPLRSRTGLLCAVTLPLLLSSAPAAAAPPAADQVTARGPLDEVGRQVARKELAGALGAYERAGSILHVPTVLLEPGAQPSILPPGVAAPTPHRSRALSYALWGVGGAGIATGTVTGILSMTNTSEANRFCSSSGACRLASQPYTDKATALAWASDIAYGVGLVGAALGTVFYFIQSSEQPPPPSTGIRFTAGPTQGGGVVGLKARF